jgi:hypothetical protein
MVPDRLDHLVALGGLELHTAAMIESTDSGRLMG